MELEYKDEKRNLKVNGVGEIIAVGTFVVMIAGGWGIYNTLIDNREITNQNISNLSNRMGNIEGDIGRLKEDVRDLQLRDKIQRMDDNNNSEYNSNPPSGGMNLYIENATIASENIKPKKQGSGG